MKKSNLLLNIAFIWTFLGKKRIWQLMGLLVLMIFSVFAEMVSLGVVVPFLSALTNPQSLMEKSWFNPIKDFFDISSADQMIFLLTLFFIISVILSSGLRVLLLWVNTRMTASMKIQLQTQLYRLALYQPYEHHLETNSSTLISLATRKIQITANATIIEVLRLIVSIFMSLGIIITLLFIDTNVALLAFGLLGGGYVMFGFISQKVLRKNSKIDAENHTLALKQIQEGVGGIRDIILDDTQEIFLKKYVEYMYKSNISGSMNAFISQLPKSILELIGILLIVILAYNLSIQGKEALPILGALALGSQRLLPSLQQIYNAWSFVIGNQETINEVVNYLSQQNNFKNKQKNDPIDFHHSITFKNIFLKYPNTHKHAIDNISLSIPKGGRIGFVGPTGSGKSTLIDIIMGLLIPTQGKFLIDGIEINEANRQGWQKHISHVPQDIYLLDSSIKENIAFGISTEHIDYDKVKIAAKKAHLDEFIVTLSNGYETSVGERGVQLSGGQRQRIGIARALYNDSSILILDEATSALDDLTEANIIEAVESLDKELTIIMIAHRLSTLRYCDTVYKLSDGKVIEKGSYEQVCV